MIQFLFSCFDVLNTCIRMTTNEGIASRKEEIFGNWR